MLVLLTRVYLLVSSYSISVNDNLVTFSDLVCGVIGRRRNAASYCV